jgi:hypothetical protein
MSCKTMGAAGNAAPIESPSIPVSYFDTFTGLPFFFP